MKRFVGIKFFGVRFGESNVTVTNHLVKKKYSHCSFAVASVLLIASYSEAMAQGGSAVLQSAMPSSSCLTRSACLADENFRLEFTNFVSFVKNKYPNSSVPSADRLQRHACRMLAPPNGFDGSSLVLDKSVDQWLASAISYSFWNTQPGMTPYQTSPVWWCFLDNSTKYTIPGVQESTGAAAIIGSFSGLGKPLANGGAGFYVNQAFTTELYPVESLEPKIYATQAFSKKELVAIDFAAPGTTKSLAEYQSLIKVKENTAYPLRTIASIKETVNSLSTIQWLGLCSFACVNCAPGTVCP